MHNLHIYTYIFQWRSFIKPDEDFFVHKLLNIHELRHNQHKKKKSVVREDLWLFYDCYFIQIKRLIHKRIWNICDIEQPQYEVSHNDVKCLPFH